MAMDNSDSEIGNPLPLHGLNFPNSSNVVLLCCFLYIHHPKDRITPAVELWVEKERNSYLTYFCLSHIIFKQDVTLKMFMFLRNFLRFVIRSRICRNPRYNICVVVLFFLLCVSYCSCCILLFLFVLFVLFVCFVFVLFVCC